MKPYSVTIYISKLLRSTFLVFFLFYKGRNGDGDAGDDDDDHDNKNPDKNQPVYKPVITTI